tara:strand:+ start:1920 stop:2891 length:972 start_codon:yes stop_codon:yes gene_type:complete
MKKNLKALYKFFPKRSGGEIQLSLTEDVTEARYGEPYPELDKKVKDAQAEMTNLEKDKEDITDKQDEKDSKELRRENLAERLKHHQDAIESIKSEMAALKKDEKEDKSDVQMESEGAKTKEQFDKIDKKELKEDTKKQKVQHEKDAIKDDDSKIKNLNKGKPSAKKSAEKKALKKDEKFDKKSEKKMEADKALSPKQKAMDKNKDGKLTKEDFQMLNKKSKGDYGNKMEKKETPKKSYAQLLIDIAAERYNGKKRSELKDSDFLDPKRRSFPVMSAQDVKDAVSSWGRYKGSMNYNEFKSKLIKRAKSIGAESALPKNWMDKK